MVQTVEAKKKIKRITLIGNETITVPATGTVTTNSAAIDISGFETAIFLVTLGVEAGTATFDAKLQYKDSSGNYYDVASGAITQMTAAGAQQLLITKLYGETARVVYVLGDAENDGFATATLELILKS